MSVFITKHGENVLMEAAKELVIENARIESTFLGMDDHGFLACLYLDYGGGGQAFQVWLSYMRIDILEAILSTVGVDQWEHLKGKYIRAEHNWEHIARIGNIIENNWVDPKDYAISKSVS